MGQERKFEEADVRQVPADEPTESRRHRPASEVRFAGRAPSATLLEPSLMLPGDVSPRPARAIATGALTDELRAGLWEVLAAALFAPSEESLRWTGNNNMPRTIVQGARHSRSFDPRASWMSSGTLRRVWSSPPLGGDLDRMPEDVDEVIEGWFSLVEAGDVYAFIETVHDNLETSFKPLFVAAINVVLERGQSDHRYVMRKLLPIAAKADIAAIERALGACKAAHWADVEKHMVDAVNRLAVKPEPDVTGAIQEAVRTVELAAFALTGEEHVSLDETLEDLEAHGHIARALKNAYAGLFTYVTSGARKPTTDDARLIVVMCAGFVNHLATQLDLVTSR
jgi:hypothetical protein